MNDKDQKLQTIEMIEVHNIWAPTHSKLYELLQGGTMSISKIKRKYCFLQMIKETWKKHLQRILKLTEVSRSIFLVKFQVHDYIEKAIPELVDVLVDQSEEAEQDQFGKKVNFAEVLRIFLLAHFQYKTITEVEIGVKNGNILQGRLYMNRDNYMEGSVTAEGGCK